MPKSTRRWSRVSVDNINIHLPWNAPIEAPGRTFAFGPFGSGDKAIAPSVGGKRAGAGDGDRNGDDGDVDDTTSSGSVDSIRVKAALQAGETQRMRYSRRKQNGNLPMSSGSPTYSAECPYGRVRRQWRRGRLKLEPTKVSQTPKVEMTYQRRASAAQPPRNDPKRCWEVHRPRRRHGRMKIEPTKVNQTRNGRNAYLGRVNAIHLIRRPRKQIRAISKLTFESRMPGEPWHDVEDHG